MKERILKEIKTWQEIVVVTESIQDRMMIFNHIDSLKEQLEYYKCYTEK
jgi:hypothetical protein